MLVAPREFLRFLAELHHRIAVPRSHALRGNAIFDVATPEDAPRPGRHSHAELVNELTQPAGLTARAGQGAAFGVAVAAVPRATFQWRKDGVDIAGATGATHAIAAAGPADEGAYTVEVRNVAGTVTSAPARLSVTSPPQGP